MSASAEVSGGSHHQPALFFLPPKRTADEAIPKIYRVQIQRGKVEIGVEEAQTQELFGRERIKKFFWGSRVLPGSAPSSFQPGNFGESAVVSLVSCMEIPCEGWEGQNFLQIPSRDLKLFHIL